MPYECQTFKKGQILTHICMNKIDEWLAYICGKEIVSGEVNAAGELVFTTCDGSTLNVGGISFSDGKDGEDGISPTVEITYIEGGKRITVTDKDGAKFADIMNGKDGKDGVDGTDGESIRIVSCEVGDDYTAVSFTDGGVIHIPNGVGISDINFIRSSPLGQFYAIELTNGQSYEFLAPAGRDGESAYEVARDNGFVGDEDAWLESLQGPMGDDGVSPTVSVSKSGKVTTVTITDKNGTKTATINDGVDGKDGADGKDGYTPIKGVDYFDGANGKEGEDGFSPTVTASKSGKVTTITITDKSGTKTATINDGVDGKDGTNGTNGNDGVGIKSVVQTTTSSEDGGSNVITVTKTDNTTCTFTVKNGGKGSAGKDGTNGTNGKDGTSVTVKSVSESTADGGNNVVTFSDGKTLTVKNGSKGKDGDTIPDYVIAEAEATISKVFSHGNLGRTIRFIAISDTHEDSAKSYNAQITESNKHAGQAIKYIADRIGLDFVAHLGDASSCGAFTTTYEPNALRDDIKNINKFVFSGVRGIKTAFIPGNHDMISTNGYSLLNSGAFPLFGNMCSGNKDRLGGWGYFDIDDAKVRVIYLNTSDSPSSAAYLALSQTQKNWLCETLIDVNTKDDADEWKVILLSHAPLDFGGANISADILLPYVNGETYGDYDFKGKNSAKIISNIHGHVHCYSYGYIGDKIRRFTVPNACFVGANHYATRTEYANWVDTTTYNKTANSGKDTAFSLVTIDLDSGMCYADNYGAGIDREFSTDYNANAEPKILLNLNRTYVSGAVEESVGNYLDESKALLNAAYTGTQDFASKSCTATGITETSVTVTEAGVGGICVAYPIHLTDIGTQAYRLTFDYSGVGKCRSYYEYATATGAVSQNKVLFVNETAGASGSVDVTIPAASGYEWLIIYFSSNTGNTKTFTNVLLTKA